MKTRFTQFIVLALAWVAIISIFQNESRANDEEKATYVGSEVCKECHEAEYENFAKYAKKAKSFRSIEVMLNRRIRRISAAKFLLKDAWSVTTLIGWKTSSSNRCYTAEHIKKLKYRYRDNRGTYREVFVS